MLKILFLFLTMSVTSIKDLVSPHTFVSFTSEPGQSEAIRSPVNPWGKSNYSKILATDMIGGRELNFCCISNINVLLSSGNIKIASWLSRAAHRTNIL